MKKLALCATATAVAAALVVVAGAVGRTTATRIQIAATMIPGEETPTPRGDVSAARGTFTATLTRSGAGATVAWSMNFSGLTGRAVAAHIHVAPRGDPGPVTVPLCGPCESGASGTANADAATIAAIAAGRAYVNVHTPTNGPGEIRGQLSTVASVRAAMNARQEIPRPAGATRARGLFTVTATKSGASARVTWRLAFSRLTGRALAAHIHLGARGRAGRVIVPLCGPCRSGVTRTVTLRGAALAALESGRAYVNVHTRRNAAGEIRGQIPALALTLT